MDELFLVIGKLYYDLLRSQGIIDSLQKQLKNQENLSSDKWDPKWQTQES